jgi:hypothetical protein
MANESWRSLKGRRSYKRLLGMPVWGLYSSDGQEVARTRAADAKDAREVFRHFAESYGYLPQVKTGGRVKRINDGH